MRIITITNCMDCPLATIKQPSAGKDAVLTCDSAAIDGEGKIGKMGDIK